MAEASDVKLLGTWVCPYVHRVKLALKLKAIDYDFIDDMQYKKNELLLKHNPVHKKIPVLIHGGNGICESLIIVQYVNDAWPKAPSILPPDTYDRALSRFWAAYVDEMWFPLVKVLREADDSEKRAALVQKVSEGLVLIEEAFVQCSKGRTYFGGDSIGYLDIVLGSCLGWLGVTEAVIGTKLTDRAETPGLATWAESFSSNYAVKDVLPGTARLLEFYKMIEPLIKAKWPGQ